VGGLGAAGFLVSDDARLTRALRRVVRTAGFAAVTASMLPTYAARDALATDATRDAVRDLWVRRWSTTLLRLFAIQVITLGEVTPTAGGRLVVANHRSTLDVGLLLRLFGGRMVSRADLSQWPLLGAAARKVGTVFVDREDAASGANAIREIRNLLKDGHTVNLFAEGTTFADDDVRPFHAGAFVAALRTGADIVPVGIAYPRGSGAQFVGESFVTHLSRLSAAKPTRVVVNVGVPIATLGVARASELKDRTHASVQELVRAARARVDAT
jgi:1-acyl-sn-glycerol-3-phosphate acyltransferase